MRKSKIFLVSSLMAASLAITGCGGGGGGSSVGTTSGSSSSGAVTSGEQVNGQVNPQMANYTYNTSTDLRVDIGTKENPEYVAFNEATFDATGDTPPSVPIIIR